MGLDELHLSGCVCGFEYLREGERVGVSRSWSTLEVRVRVLQTGEGWSTSSEGGWSTSEDMGGECHTE